MTKLDKIYLTIFVAAVVILAAIAIFDLSFVIFEDGSFNLGGCLPWAICRM